MPLPPEAQAISAMLAIKSRLIDLVRDAQAVESLPALPKPLREAMTEFVGYCDDTLADCDLSAAVDRWDEGQAERDAQALAYDREMSRPLDAHTKVAS